VSVSAGYKAFVLDQLGGGGTITAKAMFGGVGLYCQGLFFGLIDDDTLYLKWTTRPAQTSSGSVRSPSDPTATRHT
jgi:DNA transformation protein